MSVVTKNGIYPNYMVPLKEYKRYLLEFPFYTEEVLQEKYDIFYTNGEKSTEVPLLIILYEEHHKLQNFEIMIKSKIQDRIDKYYSYKLRQL